MRVLPTVSDWVLGRRVYHRFAPRPGAGHIATSRALACLAAVVRRHRPKEVVEFGAGILAAIADPARAAAIGARAGQLAATKYSYDAYLGRTREAVSRLSAPAAPQTVAGGLT